MRGIYVNCVNLVQLHTMESSESVASVTGSVVKSADCNSSDCMGSVSWEAAKSLLRKLQILRLDLKSYMAR